MNSGYVHKSPKTEDFAKTWLSDSSTYPIMGIITGALIMMVGAGVYITYNTHDARISKSDRK